jgi:hypothetical protein
MRSRPAHVLKAAYTSDLAWRSRSCILRKDALPVARSQEPLGEPGDLLIHQPACSLTR